ncbi:MAG: hypothetical protein ABSC05_17500 [Candidatus Solibacter sp.]|jgi:hypothetical protein
MKLLLVVFVSALALSAQDPQVPKEQTPQTPRKAKAAAKATPKVTDASKPTAIPVEAVQGDDGDYHYTDPQGKKWIYRKTPFGVTRMEDTPERAAGKAAAANGAGIKATEDGDIVRFERMGPFGLWKWEKKKSELDATEKAALENSQANNQTVSKQD